MFNILKKQYQGSKFQMDSFHEPTSWFLEEKYPFICQLMQNVEFVFPPKHNRSIMHIHFPGSYWELQMCGALLPNENESLVSVITRLSWCAHCRLQWCFTSVFIFCLFFCCYGDLFRTEGRWTTALKHKSLNVQINSTSC